MKPYTILNSFRLATILALTLVLVSSSCTISPLQRGDEPKATATHIQTIASGDVEDVDVIDGWMAVHHKVRDILILDQLAIVSNSAPIWGKGQNDGEPYIMAVNLHTNQVIWKLKYVPVAPIVANSRDMFVVESNRLISIELTEGNENWSIPLKQIEFTQAFSDDDLVLVADGQALYAFDAKNGDLRWKSSTAIPLDRSVPSVVSFDAWRQYSAFAKHGDLVYVRKADTSSCQSSLMALDADSGKERWSYTATQQKVSEGCLPGTIPLAFSDVVILTGMWQPPHCTLNALGEETGKVTWSYTYSENCFLDTRSVVLLDGKFTIVGDGVILALDAYNGEPMVKEFYRSGNLYQPIAVKGIIASRLDSGSEIIYRVMDLYSGETHEFSTHLPETCDSLSNKFGVSDGQVVLVEGNCIKAINIKDDQNKP